MSITSQSAITMLGRVFKRGNDQTTAELAFELGCTPAEVPYQVLFLPRLKAVYFRVPKVANSTIINTLLAAEFADEPAMQSMSSKARKLAAQELVTGHQDKLLRALKDGGHFTFSVVRNPYARIVSCYLNKIRPVRRKTHQRRQIGLPTQGELSLIEFLEAVRSQPPNEMNRHWRLQSVQIPSRARIDFVGRLENLEADLRHVCEVLGVPPVIVNAGPRPTGAGSRLADLVGPREKEIIDEVYAPDFERFGYEMRLESA